MVGFSQECTPIVCPEFAPKIDPALINRSSDLMDRFELLCVLGGDDVSSLCVSPGPTVVGSVFAMSYKLHGMRPSHL